jgi:hypothetical protein
MMDKSAMEKIFELAIQNKNRRLAARQGIGPLQKDETQARLRERRQERREAVAKLLQAQMKK